MLAQSFANFGPSVLVCGLAFFGPDPSKTAHRSRGQIEELEEWECLEYVLEVRPRGPGVPSHDGQRSDVVRWTVVIEASGFEVDQFERSCFQKTS